MKASLALLLTASVGTTLGKVYSVTDDISGTGFLSAFTHEAISDPTHGRGNYVTQNVALAQNLTYAHADTFIIRADHTTYLNPHGPGRNTVRLQSKKQYRNHVAVFNIRHMPEGCGTWPAVWEVGADWPNQGEVDILEGVNDISPNQATLHTNAGCTMPASRQMTGKSTGNNCDVNATGNESCGVKSPTALSYGPAFNAAGGGYYAVERTDQFIKMWFWSRNATIGATPEDVLEGSKSVNTNNWGTPFAYFPNNYCNLDAKFGAHSIIINIALCGDWAGAVFGQDKCPGSCIDYVNNHPSAFQNAFFDFEWLKVYS